MITKITIELNIIKGLEGLFLAIPYNNLLKVMFLKSILKYPNKPTKLNRTKRKNSVFLFKVNLNELISIFRKKRISGGNPITNKKIKREINFESKPDPSNLDP